jgi:hypothetical protein
MRSLRRCDEKIVPENTFRARRRSHYFAWPVSDGRLWFFYQLLSGSVVHEIRFACPLLHRFNFHRRGDTFFLYTREYMALCGLQRDAEALATRLGSVGLFIRGPEL